MNRSVLNAGKRDQRSASAERLNQSHLIIIFEDAFFKTSAKFIQPFKVKYHPVLNSSKILSLDHEAPILV
jgi:hypothetical protein